MTISSVAVERLQMRPWRLDSKETRFAQKRDILFQQRGFVFMKSDIRFSGSRFACDQSVIRFSTSRFVCDQSDIRFCKSDIHQ
jgi:hypothetical protein